MDKRLQDTINLFTKQYSAAEETVKMRQWVQRFKNDEYPSRMKADMINYLNFAEKHMNNLIKVTALTQVNYETQVMLKEKKREEFLMHLHDYMQALDGAIEYIKHNDPPHGQN